MVCAWRRFRPGCPYLLPAGGGGIPRHVGQAKLQLSYGCHGATCKPGFWPGCLFHCRGGGAAPASIQTRQCFRLECLCQLTGGKSSAIHHNGNPPASQNVQHSFFFLDLKGLGLAHRPGCVPGAASSRAVLTNCLLRGVGGGHHQPAFKPGELPAGLFYAS